MTIKPSRTCFAAAFALSGAAFCAGAAAQSLTLSLKLDPVAAAPAAEHAVAVVDRCSGRSWAASLAASCSIDAFSSSRTPAAAPDAAPSGEMAEAAAERTSDENAAVGETFSGFGLPSLGSLSAAGLLRAAREMPIQASKAVELLVRFASKYRLRNAEENSDVFRFKDVTSENRTQASGIKSMGVELVLPFQ